MIRNFTEVRLVLISTNLFLTLYRVILKLNISITRFQIDKKQLFNNGQKIYSKICMLSNYKRLRLVSPTMPSPKLSHLFLAYINNRKKEIFTKFNALSSKKS